MKKLFAFVLCFAIVLLSACSADPQQADNLPNITLDDSLPGSGSTNEQDPAPDEPSVDESVTEDLTDIPAPSVTRAPISATANILSVGNFDILIPEGFSISSLEENTASLVSEDGDCVIGVFAADVSKLSEDQIISYLPSQHASFMSKDTTRFSEDTIDLIMGPFDLTLDLYAEMGSDYEATANMDFSFTDSWFTYTIMFRCLADSDKTSDYSVAFANFCGYAEYVGEDPRFDFVQ